MNPALSHIRDILIGFRNEVKKDIIGQDELIDKLLITVFSGGHALLEGVPGLGKTRTIRSLAMALSLDTKRISFTPDLLPSDLTGNEIYRVKDGKFEVRKGPIFTGILLADEINRTPPKVQSALLEAMEEKRVTIGEKTLDLPLPFIVFATQNPLEHEGTYPLPEAQLDRFLMKIVLDYPSREDERQILIQETSIKNSHDTTKSSSTSLSKLGINLLESEYSVPHPLSVEKDGTTSLKEGDFLEIIDYIAKNIRVDEKIYEYVGDILTELRKLTQIPIQGKREEAFALLSYGPSTRAGLALIRAGRIHALLDNRDYMLPDDVKSLAHDILDHRIGLSYEAQSEGVSTWSVTAKVLENVKII
ncbi:AAA family ATPase [Candidatus Gracilibacteria bacterium]|nr:AAA family ATPase [Candidatus Gracilibacteria bacterium]